MLMLNAKLNQNYVFSLNPLGLLVLDNLFSQVKTFMLEQNKIRAYLFTRHLTLAFGGVYNEF